MNQLILDMQEWNLGLASRIAEGKAMFFGE